MIGDVDISDEIDAYDAITILRASIMLENFDALQNILADVNDDGVIDAIDAFEVLRFSVGLETTSNAGQPIEIDLNNI